MVVIKRMEEFEEIVLQDEGAKGVKKRVLSPEGRPFIVRLFSIEPNGNTPYHTHPWEHQVVVLSGKGKVVTGNGSFDVEEGFYVFIPPNEPHQFVNTGDRPLKLICIIPGQGQG